MKERCVSIRNVLLDREVEGVEDAGATTVHLQDHNDLL